MVSLNDSSALPGKPHEPVSTNENPRFRGDHTGGESERSATQKLVRSQLPTRAK